MSTEKIANLGQAANIYAKTSNIGTEKIAGDDSVSFSDFLKKNISQSIDTIKQGEKTSALAVTGEADLSEVVQAVNAAELTLQTVVAVRDRLVSAYQEIMRMPL
jgi:flagellar hook-basal body complex protein FliE